jgi:hypothetical protein
VAIAVFIAIIIDRAGAERWFPQPAPVASLMGYREAIPCWSRCSRSS